MKMSGDEALNLVASLLALQVVKGTAMLAARPEDFSNGYRAASIDSLEMVNNLIASSKARNETIALS
jgi:hypothetical protein